MQPHFTSPHLGNYHEIGNITATMKTEHTNSSHRFVFWLFDWATHRVSTSLRYYPRYIRCDIDATGITIYDSTKPFHILHTQVKSCEIYRFGQGRYAGPANNVKLVVTDVHADQKSATSGNQFYLVPVNPFHNEPGISEIEDMVEVINTFRAGNFPLLSTNPYERELIRLGRAGEFDVKRWDELTPPNIYTPVPNPFVFLLKLIVWGAVGTLIITILLGTLYNLFN